MHSILLSLILLLADPSATTNLTGHALDPDGAPLPNATVLIYTASPKKGPPTQNPTDYPDCSKSTTTDSQGAFAIAGVDSSLRFEILVLADNFRPLLLKKVDPTRGDIRANLQILPKDTDEDHLIHGHIVDSNGDPIVGARIEPFLERNVGQNGWTSATKDVEDYTFTNTKGEFTLVCKKSGIEVRLKLSAHNAAPMLTQFFSQGDQVNELTLTPGASITGRLVKDGAPVPGVTMDFTQVDRNIEHWVGDFTAITDANGKFTLSHVKPGQNYYLYATMKTLGNKGAVSIKPFSAGDDSTTTDVGDISVETGVTVAGLLVDPDGKPVPNLKVGLSREDVSDDIEVKTDADGKFQFKSIAPGEVYDFYLQADSYHVTHNNQSFEPLNALFLMGLIDQDINDLKVEIDKGPREQPTNNANNWQSLRHTLLTGIPAEK